ncbi:MAG TPA: discoidin domain-containing protein, partial [Thermoanaerobaculia bacterium]
ATAKLAVAPGDVLYTYVLIDPCNPPREILLQFYDGTSWDHRAYWGEDLVLAGATSTRTRLGPVPAAGGWVRLEVPAHAVDLDKRSVEGMTFTLYDGAAWFDVVGRISRVNLAAGKTAKQSSSANANTGPERAVDGNTDGNGNALSITHTNWDAQAWWEVDLGSVQPIDTIQIWNRTDCCSNRLGNYIVFVSNTEIGAKTVAQALATPGVRAFRHAAGSGTVTDFRIQHAGRFVRVQLQATEYLHMAEVQVWSPIQPLPRNVAGGVTTVTQSSVASGGTADRAVDGVVNGDYNNESSVTHTNGDANAWWEVDLGSVQQISTIDIVNRLDCCSERLQNFYVFVSDEKLADNLLSTALAHAGVARWFRGPNLRAQSFDVNRTGRYVRVQLSGSDFLSLTEVQIWSRDKSLLGMAKVVPRD